MHIQSGVEHGVSLGTPIGLLVKNEDQRPKDYSETDLYPRPSHADYTYLEKYGIKASSGGGRSSARETIGKRFIFVLLRQVLRKFSCRTSRRGRDCREIPEASLRSRDRCLRVLRRESDDSFLGRRARNRT